MCMWYLCGRLLAVDPPFENQFLANPAQVAQQLGATRVQAQRLAALKQADLKQLITQARSISNALGAEAQRQIASDVGVQIVLGRALLDPAFATRLQTKGDEMVTQMLGRTPSAKTTAAIVKSPEFARLKGFSAQRQALKGA